MKLNEECSALRKDILDIAKRVDELRKRHLSPGEVPEGDIGEVKANATLAYRHLEDARMRLGKTIQAFEGRESIYPG